jgi:transposase
MLRRLLSHLGYMEKQIEELSGRIGRELAKLLDPQKQKRLDAVPGIGPISVENVIAEIGPDMDVFPDERHLSSWTGICPGNEESAGKRLRSRTRKGNRWLWRALSEAAWGASRQKDRYLATQYRRLAARRGKKRALLAVGHSLLVIIYHLLKRNVEYPDLGARLFRPPRAGAVKASPGQTLGLRGHLAVERLGR